MPTTGLHLSPPLIRRLFWGAVGCTILAICLGIIALFHDSRDSRQHRAREENHRQQTAYYALAISSQFRHTAYVLLQSLSVVQETATNTAPAESATGNTLPPGCTAWLETVQSAAALTRMLVITDGQGQVLCSAGTLSPASSSATSPLPLEERLLIGRALASRGMVHRIVPPERNNPGPEASGTAGPAPDGRYLLALPWGKENAPPQGVLLAELDIRILAEALAALSLTAEQAVVLLDGAGTVLVARTSPAVSLENITTLLGGEGILARLRHAETTAAPLSLPFPDHESHSNTLLQLTIAGQEEGREGVRALLLTRHSETVRTQGVWLVAMAAALICALLLWLELSRQNRLLAEIQRSEDHNALEQMKAAFAATISHELRTPLTAIRAALGMVNSGRFGLLPQEARELTTIAAQSAERLVQLINDILDLEKVATGTLRLNRRPLMLAPLITRAVAEIQPEAQAAHIPIQITSPLPDVAVLADAERLLQIVSGLLANAIKFSPAGSPVTVTLRRPSESPGQVVVDIRDCGPGIPEHFRPRLFAPFSQADSSDRRTKGGAGLGLSLIRGLVEHLGGTISVSSTVGMGATFHVTLPVWAPPTATGETAATAEAAALVPPSAPMLLVCEDDPFVARLLCTLLERAGFTTAWAATVAEARRHLASGNFAAMTLDLQLPDEPGLSLLRQLRDDPHTRDLPVVVVAAAADAGRAQLHGEAFGVVDWLNKPIDRQRLLAAVQRALQHQPLPAAGAGGQRPRILHVEDDADIRSLVARLLEKEMEVTPAATLAEARTYALTEAFDLAVIDVELPDGSGLDVVPLLKNAYGHTLPIVIFSAGDPPASAMERVTAILLKSRASHQELVATIRSLVRTPGAASADSFSADPASTGKNSSV